MKTYLNFSTPMVQALLGGRKTQTRRVMKPQPGGPPSEGAYFDDYDGGPQWNWWTADNRVCNNAPIVRCPHGNPGDLLYVRESFWDRTDRLSETHDLNAIHYVADGWRPPEETVHLRRKRPSIHMPRWASRLTLKLTDIRVERVQEISEADAMAEGCTLPEGYEELAIAFFKQPCREVFIDLWDSINGKRGYGWDANPWVWVLEFEVIRANVDDVVRRPS